MILFGEKILLLIYDKQELLLHGYLIYCLSFIYIINSIGNGLVNYFKVLKKTNIIFWSRVIGVFNVLIFSMLLINSFSLFVIGIIYLIGTISSVSFLAYVFLKNKGN
jgi:O-antigen/teichoic acid export membrane protein